MTIRTRTTGTMLEYMNNDGNFEWYAVIVDASPSEALEYYAKEHGIEGETIEKIQDDYVLGTDIARAYQITLTSIK